MIATALWKINEITEDFTENSTSNTSTSTPSSGILEQKRSSLSIGTEELCGKGSHWAK